MVTIFWWKMELHKSLGTASEDVFTMHFCGEASPENTVLDGYRAAGSKLVISPSFGYKKKPGIGLRTWSESGDCSIDLTKFGPWVVYASSSKKTAFPEEDIRKYGLVYHEEESGDRMDGLLAVKHSIEYVILPAKSEGLIMFPGEQTIYSQFSNMTDVEGDIQITIPIGAMRANDYGKELSKLANGVDKIRKYLFFDPISQRPNYDPDTKSYTYLNDRALRWVKHLMEHGQNRINEVKGFGVVDLSSIGGEAATFLDSILLLDEDLVNIAWKRAEARGLEGKAAEEYVASYINSVLEHEEYHFLEERTLTRRGSERRAGTLQQSRYKEESKLREGTLQGRIYSFLAEHYAAYARTALIRGSSLQSLSELEELADELTEEAQALGIGGTKISDYVEKKLEKYVKNKSEESDESVLEEETKAKVTENNDKYSEKQMKDGEDTQEQVEVEQDAGDASTEEA